MKNQTLLEKAKNHKSTRKVYKHFVDEEVELCLEWLKGNIIYQQVSFAIFGHTKPSSAQGRLCALMREAYRQKRIKVI
jgi:hypothetical protein